MSNNCKIRDPKKIPIKQIENQLVDGFQQGDVLRQKGLGGMATIKRAKLINVRYERARMEEKHGRDSEQTKKLDRSMFIEHKQLIQARAELDKVNAPPLKRKYDQWTLHGYVRDADGCPVKKQRVSLYIDDQLSEQPLATVNSDNKGYYKFDRSLNRETATSAIVTNVQQPQVLYIAVQSKNGDVLHQECKPVYAAAGGLAYRDISIDRVTRAGKENCPTQYLGNINSHEFHDLNNEKKNCFINRMRPEHRIYFRTTDQGEKSGYDYCVQCFGKKKPKC